MSRLAYFLVVSIILTSSIGRAECLPAYEAKIAKLEKRLLRAKKIEKRTTAISSAAVGIPGAIFWGTMFQLITDGATIPASILVGAGFGTVMAAPVAGAVVASSITYNQILKGQIRAYEKTYELLQSVKAGDVQNKYFQKMLNDLQQKGVAIEAPELMEIIKRGNDDGVFCQEDEKLFKRRHVAEFAAEFITGSCNTPDR